AAVTHDPREAVYLGRRVIVLGKPPRGILLDEPVDLSPRDSAYASPAHLEERLLSALTGGVP
ncbi:MAG: ABC transporter ATP-binding protein, partial [Spirochaetaceae bacterium]|nr:ABC transporter ATP-binding protein [Spirochaetaceae bacterium]